MPIDYKDYPRNWKTEIVPAIRLRSGDCCENCGIQNGLVITRHKDGSWSEPSGQDWSLINAFVATGHTIAQSLKRYGFFRIILTTAHWDQNKKNNTYHPEDKTNPSNNLFHWCQRCHLRHDRNQHDYNRRFGRRWKDSQTVLDLDIPILKPGDKAD